MLHLIHAAPSRTDEILAEKILLERCHDLQRLLIAANRRCSELATQADHARRYIAEARAALLEIFHDRFEPAQWPMGQVGYIPLDASDWPPEVDFPRLVTEVVRDDNGEREFQFWLVRYEDQQAVYEVSRLF